MIVGVMFSDDDLDLAWRQHDVYRSAFGIIVEITNRYTVAAKQILNDAKYEHWGHIQSVDHRTLQAGHDFLAAVWRWHHIHPTLDFQEQPRRTVEEDWLFWLRQEVESWINAPRMIRYVQIILSNQNEEIGYAAEDALNISLLERFQEVGWFEKTLAACQADYRRHSPDIFDDATGISSKPLCMYNTYRFQQQVIRHE